MLEAGCQSDLDAAYDDYRAQAPSVCKDYCEEKIACENTSYTSTGEELDNSFAAKIHQCVTYCTSYAVEGAYVWNSGINLGYDRNYREFIDGDMLFDGFECLYNMGAYRCVKTGSAYVHKFNAPVKSVCEASNSCITGFNVDYSWYWQINSNGIGGTCKHRGTDNIDAIFFK